MGWMRCPYETKSGEVSQGKKLGKTCYSRNWHPYCLARCLSSVRDYTCVCYSRNGDEVDCPSGLRGGFIVSTIVPLLYVIFGSLFCFKMYVNNIFLLVFHSFFSFIKIVWKLIYLCYVYGFNLYKKIVYNIFFGHVFRFICIWFICNAPLNLPNVTFSIFKFNSSLVDFEKKLPMHNVWNNVC
jgi:hypothetical protein